MKTILRVCTVLVACAIASTALAQRTWRVGWLGYPHNDFDEIQHAFDAASPGDVIIVDSDGVPYLPATTNKGVSLLSTNGWRFNTPITVEDLPAGQTFAIEGFTGPFPFVCRRCEGAIHGEAVDFLGAGICTEAYRTRFEKCRFVSLNHSSVWGCVVDRCTALFSDTLLLGSTSCPAGEYGQPALTMIDSDVTFSGGGAVGAPVYPPGPSQGGPGVLMQGGTLRMASAPNIVGNWLGGEYIQPPWPHPPSVSPALISNGGTVLLSSDLRISGALLGNSPITFAHTPFMRVQKVPPPSVGVLPIEVFAPVGASAVACLSLPHLPIATHLGDLWLDPSPGGIAVVASAVMPPSGRILVGNSLSLAWPPGVTPAFQAVIVHQGQIVLSAPVIGVGGVGF